MAEIFRRAGPAPRERMAGRLDTGRLKVMGAIEACRTATFGGHIYRCDGCGREHPLYNSCRNRHCPSCQGLAAIRWSEARATDILPVPYFHVVFTLPVEIAVIAFCNRGIVFDILFRTVAETLRTIAADRRHGGIRIDGIAVLHTWDQKLLFHPYLHVVVPNASFDVGGGGWKTGSSTFLAPVKVLASLFRRRFLEELARAHGKGEIAFHGDIARHANLEAFHAVLAAARCKDWVVRETALPGARAGLPIPLPLHPQDRHLGQPHHSLQRPDHLIQIPKAWETGTAQATLRHRHRRRRRVHPALPAARPPGQSPPHPPLRHPRQRLPRQDAGKRLRGAWRRWMRPRRSQRRRRLDGKDDHDAGTAPPATYPHCGTVLRRVSEIRRRQASHPTWAPPGAQQNQTPQP